jgi:predicted dehydrogenase
LGYPLLAAMNIFENEPTEIQKSIHFNEQLKVDVSASMQMKFKNSESAQIYVGMGLNYRSRYSILGSKGRIEVTRAFAVNPDQSVKINLEVNDQTKVIEISAQDQFLNMIDYFSKNLVKSSKEISKEYENILRLLKILRS